MVYRVSKKPWLGAILTLIFGPFGFLYYSWRKALVAILLFFIPNLFLYELNSKVAEIFQWVIHFIFAIYTFYDLKGNLIKLENILALIINTISIPIIFLNFFSGIIGGIWLITLGQWKFVLGTFIFSLLVPTAFSIIFIIQMPLGALLVYLQRKNKKRMGLTIGFINLFVMHVIIIAYVIFIFSKAVQISETLNLSIIAVLLLGYSVATGPLSYMASKERSDSTATFIGVFVAQISYILFSFTYLFNYLPIAIPILLLVIFGLEIYQMVDISRLWDIEEEDLHFKESY